MRRAALALILASSLAGAAPGSDQTSERWFEVLGPAGQLVGFQVESLVQAAGGAVTVRRERRLSYRVDGHPVSRQALVLIRHFDAQGRLTGLQSDQTAGAERMVVAGTVEGGTLRLVRDYAGQRTARDVALPAGGAVGDALAAEQQPGARFELAASGLALEQRRLVTLAQSAPGRVLRLGKIGERLDSAEFVTRDAAGLVERVELPQLGYSLTLRRSARPIRLGEIAQARQLPHEMWRSPFFIAKDAMRGQIRYRLALPAGLDIAIPETGEQRVRQVEGAYQFDVCGDCGPGLASDPATLAQWTRPSPWIESTASEFQRAVRPVLARGGNDRARMKSLGGMARKRLKGIDYEGHRSARSAWLRGSGDCTEDAVVLAALARAAGIPARVASGLVYSRGRYHGAANAFLPHSWVLAWVDGRWESFDISLEGFDASHIALSIGDGEPGSLTEASRLAALLEWQAMSEVRKRS
jgi:Transglutaminase-like superfamily